MSLPIPGAAWVGPRRSWLLAGCAVLAVAIYLVGWVAYAVNGLTALGRLDQRAPGAVVSSGGSDFRLLSLTRTDEIRAEESGTDGGTADAKSEAPELNASWVVAEIEVTRRQDVPDFYCSFELVGPDRRRWEPDAPPLTRATTSFCKAEELPLGRPGRVEVIFEIPNVFLDRIYGVAVPDVGTRDATPVLRPADS